MTSPYVLAPARSLEWLRQTVLTNIAWHRRSLAERETRLAEIDAELNARDGTRPQRVHGDPFAGDALTPPHSPDAPAHAPAG